MTKPGENVFGVNEYAVEVHYVDPKAITHIIDAFYKATRDQYYLHHVGRIEGKVDGKYGTYYHAIVRVIAMSRSEAILRTNSALMVLYPKYLQGYAIASDDIPSKI